MVSGSWKVLGLGSSVLVYQVSGFLVLCPSLPFSHCLSTIQHLSYLHFLSSPPSRRAETVRTGPQDLKPKTCQLRPASPLPS